MDWPCQVLWREEKKCADISLFDREICFQDCLLGAVCVFWSEMFFLKYIFGLRERSVADEEKPFLSHLEDLRKTLFKVAGTLIVAMLVCLNFSGQILDFLRAPVENVWTGYERSHLPSGISAARWVDAKRLAEALPGLPEKAQKALLARETAEMKDLAEAALLLRAMRTLPEKDREGFLKEGASGAKVADMVVSLQESKALLQVGDTASGVKMMSTLQPTEGFNLSLKLAFYAGLVVSFPLVVLFVLEFVLPGLKQNERKTLFGAMFIGFGLFLTGVAFAYYVVLPGILDFFFSYSMDMGISNDWRIGFYLNFAIQFVMLFGLAFELPVIVMPFVKLGILNYDMMKITRRYAIVIIAVLAAVLTPADVLSMVLMGIPMYLLYEICIIMAWREDKRRKAMEREENSRTAEEWEKGLTPYQPSGAEDNSSRNS